MLILGGFTSVPGAIVGGLIIGASEKLAEVYVGPIVGGGIEGWFPYMLALAFLLVRPEGLFGESTSTACDKAIARSMPPGGGHRPDPCGTEGLCSFRAAPVNIKTSTAGGGFQSRDLQPNAGPGNQSRVNSFCSGVNRQSSCFLRGDEQPSRNP